MYKKYPLSCVGALLVIAALASREGLAVPPPAATAGAWVARTNFPGFIEHVAVAGSDIYFGHARGIAQVER